MDANKRAYYKTGGERTKTETKTIYPQMALIFPDLLSTSKTKGLDLHGLLPEGLFLAEDTPIVILRSKAPKNVLFWRHQLRESSREFILRDPKGLRMTNKSARKGIPATGRTYLTSGGEGVTD